MYDENFSEKIEDFLLQTIEKANDNGIQLTIGYSIGSDNITCTNIESTENVSLKKEYLNATNMLDITIDRLDEKYDIDVNTY